jgi:hypothetical protein
MREFSRRGQTFTRAEPDSKQNLTFYASPKLAMEAPPKSFAYTLLLSPDFSKQ